MCRSGGAGVLVLLVLAATGLGATACRQGERQPAAPATTTTAGADAGASGMVLQAYDFGGDFVLTAQDGQPFDLSKGRGRVHLLFFGFTHCPDVCPLTLSRIARALALLTPEERRDVLTLFVTVDVDRDTPAVLAAHLSGFPVAVTGLTGTRAAVNAVVSQYRASYEITPSDSAAGPSVSHSTYLYLIDREGRVRHLFRLADGPDVIAAGLRLALRDPRSGAGSAR